MLRLLLFASLIAYPFILYVSLPRFGPELLAVLLAVLVLGRALLAGWLHTRALLVISCLLLFIAAIGWSGDERLLKAYPVVVSLALLLLFTGSLWRGPTIIERGLRAAGRQVPDHARQYLWWVTLAWALFFAANAIAAAWTALYGSLRVWTLYNGLLSYLLIGLMFAVELLVRRWYRRRFTTDG